MTGRLISPKYVLYFVLIVAVLGIGGFYGIKGVFWLYGVTHPVEKQAASIYNPAEMTKFEGVIDFNNPYEVVCNEKIYMVWLVQAYVDSGHDYVGLYEGYHGESLTFVQRQAPGMFVAACHKFVIMPGTNGFDMYKIKVYGK